MEIYTVEEKRELLSKWKESNKTIAGFCREKGIKPTTFYGWIKKEKKKEKRGFVKLAGPREFPETITGKHLILEKSGIKITIDAGIEKGKLKEILEVMVSL